MQKDDMNINESGGYEYGLYVPPFLVENQEKQAIRFPQAGVRRICAFLNGRKGPHLYNSMTLN